MLSGELIAASLRSNMLGFGTLIRVFGIALFLTASAGAQSIAALSEFADWIGSPVLSPDGKTLAFEWEKPDLSWKIYLRPFRGGEAVDFVGRDDRDGSPGDPRWSPDGTEIAFSRFYCAQCSHKLFVKNYAHGGERPLGDVCGGASWTPRGRFLIAAVPVGKNSDECGIALIPVAGSRRIMLVRKGEMAAVSPDGRRLAFADDNQVKLVSLDENFQVAGVPAILEKEPHGIASITWSPDSRNLLYQVWGDGSY